VARIRTIKPGFFRSLTVTELPKPTRLTWIGLWTYVDDAGRGVDDARLIKAELWPLDDDYPAKKVEKDLQLLEANGSIRRYVVDGRKYLAIVEWHHQRIDKPTPSLLPPPPETDRGGLPPNSGSSPGALQEASVQEKEEGLGREGEVEQGSASSSSKLDVAPGEPAEEEDHSQSWNSLLVARLVARRRHDKRDEPIPEGYRRDSWLKTTAEDVQAKHSPEILDHLAAGHPIEAVVDLLEPPEQAPAAPTSPYPAYVPPADPGPEPADAGNGLAMVRSALGGGA
jgi:hypothetical protein